MLAKNEGKIPVFRFCMISWFCVDLPEKIHDDISFFRIRMTEPLVQSVIAGTACPLAFNEKARRPGGAGDELNQQIYRDDYGDIKYI